MPVSWQEKLHAANTEREVLHVARDYLAQFSAMEIMAMPEVCRPRKLKDANDLTEYAFDLVRHHCDDGTGANYALHRLTSFFSGAAQRLSQLLHERSENDDQQNSQQSA